MSWLGALFNRDGARRKLSEAAWQVAVRNMCANFGHAEVGRIAMMAALRQDNPAIFRIEGIGGLVLFDTPLTTLLDACPGSSGAWWLMQRFLMQVAMDGHRSLMLCGKVPEDAFWPRGDVRDHDFSDRGSPTQVQLAALSRDLMDPAALHIRVRLAVTPGNPLPVEAQMAAVIGCIRRAICPSLIIGIEGIELCNPETVLGRLIEHHKLCPDMRIMMATSQPEVGDYLARLYPNSARTQISMMPEEHWPLNELPRAERKLGTPVAGFAVIYAAGQIRRAFVRYPGAPAHGAVLPLWARRKAARIQDELPQMARLDHYDQAMWMSTL